MFEKNNKANTQYIISWLFACSLLLPFAPAFSADEISRDKCVFGETPCVFPLRTYETSDKKQSSGIESERGVQGRGTNEGPVPESDSCRDIFSARQPGDKHDAGKLSAIC